MTKSDFAAERENQSYHPGRCAKVWCGETYIGILGQIHPAVAANYGVDAEMYCAELSFDWRCTPCAAVSPCISRCRASLRSRATSPSSAALRFLWATWWITSWPRAASTSRAADIFDVYTGHHIAEGKKSVAFSLTMRADDQTLTDDHAEETVKKVLAALERKFGASIR